MNENKENIPVHKCPLDIALLSIMDKLSGGENDLDLKQIYKAVKLGTEYRDELNAVHSGLKAYKEKLEATGQSLTLRPRPKASLKTYPRS